MRPSEVMRHAKLTVEAFTSPHEFDSPEEYLDYLTEELCALALVCDREPVEMPKAWCR